MSTNDTNHQVIPGDPTVADIKAEAKIVADNLIDNPQVAAKLFNTAFWTSAIDRAIHVAAVSATSALGLGTINVFQLPYQDIIGVSAGAALLSVLTSIARATSHR
jgi:hypothetical protein